MSEREKYAKYLCSREWWIKRNAVMDRCGGICERCGRKADHVHHLTYIRKYNELLSDLQALCEACHCAAHGRDVDRPDDLNIQASDHDEVRRQERLLAVERALAEEFGLREQFDQVQAAREQLRSAGGLSSESGSISEDQKMCLHKMWQFRCELMARRALRETGSREFRLRKLK